MNHPIGDPDEVVCPIENRAFLAYVVQLREVLFELFTVSDVVDVLLEQSLDYQGKRSEEQVVAGDVVVIVKGLTRETSCESKHELWQSEDQVLIKEVENQLGVSEVAPPAMDQDKPP